MKTIFILIKKEYLEYIREHKLIILVAVFAILGISNPLIAKMTPWLFEQFLNDVSITIPIPTVIDSWMQFFKNIGQIALIIFTIIFSNCINREINQSTLINLLTKGLKRQSVILSKFIALSSLWTILYVLSIVITWGYNCYYFTGYLANLPIALFALWLFGIFIISLIILGNLLIKNNYGGLLLAGIVMIIGLFLNGFNILSDYNPIVLFANSNNIMTNTTITCTINIIITTILTIGCIICSINIFNHQEV
ncbi:MAG: ABC transporter permease [Thomasclavelia sp.]|uniref:ABC transporter permease n=1 Tax=Thomasclavelia sp. TaxID=3025757 RepID=UPI0039A3339A